MDPLDVISSSMGSTGKEVLVAVSTAQAITTHLGDPIGR